MPFCYQWKWREKETRRVWLGGRANGDGEAMEKMQSKTAFEKNLAKIRGEGKK